MFSSTTSEQLQQLQEIVEQLDRGIRTPATGNRHSAPRMNIRSDMSLILLGSTGLPSLTVYSRNVSRSGIAFISRRPFAVGERVAITFGLPGQPHKLVLMVTTFSRYVRSGVHEVGGHFLEAVPDTKGRDRIPEHWLPAYQKRGAGAGTKTA